MSEDLFVEQVVWLGYEMKEFSLNLVMNCFYWAVQLFLVFIRNCFMCLYMWCNTDISFKVMRLRSSVMRHILNRTNERGLPVGHEFWK